MAKLSEKHLREEKVEKLKTKILKEIYKCVSELKNYLLSYNNDPENLTDSVFNDYVTELYSLLQLKAFILKPTTFMRAACVDENQDYISYYVDDHDLDIWLQDDYKFALNFIENMYHKGPMDLVNMLREYYFAYNFTNIFDSIIYDKKLGERLRNESIN